MYGTLFGDFPGYPWFPDLVGTLSIGVDEDSDQNLDISSTKISCAGPFILLKL